MKPNRLTRLLTAGAVSAIALTTALAEESTTKPSTSTDDSSASSSSTTTVTSGAVEGSGTVADKPGSDFVTVKTETSTAPIMYYFTKATTLVDADGKKMDWAALKAHTPLKYTYITEGDRMVLQKVTVQKATKEAKH